MIRIISNFKELDKVMRGEPIVHEFISDDASTTKFILKCLRSDVVILNINQKGLMLACLLKWILPFAPFSLVSVDLILRQPKTRVGRIKTRVKKILFSRVDRFILYFKDLRSYERLYGIGPDRARYVPFKVNGWEQITARPRGTSEGEYVLCAGRTLRDIETFVEAIKRAGCPGVLLQQRSELLAEHGTSAWSGELPQSVKLIIDDSDQIGPYLDFIEKASVVVIPRFRGDIAPTGISTYLVAMALNKCVIISEGPGAEDILIDKAVIVPPEDPQELAAQIKRLWDDDELRSAVAARGYEYATSLGGQERFLSDVLHTSIQSIEGARTLRSSSGPI
jgi:glycosyltransferase involved in cell wall biosynthesis